MRSWAAGTLVFCTSAAVLVLEILALRLLAPYVGETLETYTGIIGTVLAGIAAGSALGGRIADRVDPRPLLGPTLVAAGVLAWLSLPILDALGPEVGSDPAGIVFLTSLAFLLPAAVLSAVGPMAAKLRLADLGETGTVVGGLSAAGTAGALFGTFTTGFVLVAALPTRPIVVGVGGLLVVAGFALWIGLGRRPRRGEAVVAVVAVLASASLGLTADGPCQRETQYFCARIEADPANPGGRTLWLDTVRHSYVDLDDPTHVEFRYLRLFVDVVDTTLAPGPIDALHIGGGGFTFPRYLDATRPGTRSLVLEIDAELVELVEDELGLERGPGLDVVVDDARLSIRRQPDAAFDLVVGDAFGGQTVPWHLTTEEMVRDIRRVLRPEGLYVINVIDGGADRFVRAEVATLAAVFEHVAVVAPPPPTLGQPRNHVLVASESPLPELDVDTADGLVFAGSDLETFVDGARRLTDDFAPVDQLITSR